MGQENIDGGKMRLTDIKIKNAKPAGKPYKLFDGGGLYLEILPHGSKLWRLKYRYLGKEKRISFGAYPIVRLIDARERREEAKRLLSNDIDPSTDKVHRRQQLVRNAENTFKAVALDWFDVKKERITKGYAEKLLRRMEIHLFPRLGNRPLNDIQPPELLECLRQIEKSGAHDMAGRCRQTAGEIFRYGIQTGKCDRDSSADLRGALKPAKKQHFPSLDSSELPAFINALENNSARLYERTRRAIWLSLLTFCRPGEIRQARWEDIDLENQIWKIPAVFMKTRRDHIVPLSDKAIEILRLQKEETGYINTPWVFPSQVKPRQPMSNGTVNHAIKRLGYGKDMVAHGFRALARTTIREKLGYDSEIIERQLAHKASGPLGEAYDRTQFIPERKKMMSDWAGYLDVVVSEENVIQGNFKKSA